MKKLAFVAGCLLALSSLYASADDYVPSEATRKAQQEFADARFGVFLHWGIYSMFGQGEWYLNYGPNRDEYAKAAAGFYPANFNAKEWVSAIKDAGAKYITLTSRHHDGFSMWGTKQSAYNIVDATPFRRDILKELADECHRQGIKLNLYYSHIDWGRDDYPAGRTGRTTGKDLEKANWPHYKEFMENQLTELLTNYGPIGAIWFDGWWDHEEDPTPFDWELREQYDLIHSLQPSCLVANNHHQAVFPGEDIQIFERDLPGENLAGYSGQDISRLPLETCTTMNGMWGYKIKDQDYKDVPTLIRLLVGAAGKGANLLLNMGPQPSGDLPEAGLERLKGIGEWMKRYGETIYETSGAPFPAQSWGTATRKGKKMFVHVMTPEAPVIYLPLKEETISEACFFDEPSRKVPFQKVADGYTLTVGNLAPVPDTILTLTLK